MLRECHILGRHLLSMTRSVFSLCIQSQSIERLLGSPKMSAQTGKETRKCRECGTVVLVVYWQNGWSESHAFYPVDSTDGQFIDDCPSCGVRLNIDRLR